MVTPHKNAKQKSSRGGGTFFQFVKEHYIVRLLCCVVPFIILPPAEIKAYYNFVQSHGRSDLLEPFKAFVPILFEFSTA